MVEEDMCRWRRSSSGGDRPEWDPVNERRADNRHHPVPFVICPGVAGGRAGRQAGREGPVSRPLSISRQNEHPHARLRPRCSSLRLRLDRGRLGSAGRHACICLSQLAQRRSSSPPSSPSLVHIFLFFYFLFFYFLLFFFFFFFCFDAQNRRPRRPVSRPSRISICLSSSAASSDGLCARSLPPRRSNRPER